MIRDIWRSLFAALALVTVSACAVAPPTGDDSIAGESEPDVSSSSGAASEDDGHDVGSVESRPSTVPSPSETHPPKSLPDDPNGPYPEPWSAKAD